MTAPWRLIAVLAAGSIATMTAATIVNVALPSVIGALGLGQDEAQWLSTAFLAASTGFMLLNTWAVARFGMRASFALAMSAFIAGSVIGATAQDLGVLIVGRILQGAGAGLIQPMAMLVIYRHVREDRRGLAIGLYSLCVIASPAFGPVLGGAMIEAFDWRIVFIATAPLALLVLPVGLWLLPARDDNTRPRLDGLGLALVMAAIALLLQGLAHAAREGWDDAGTSLRLAGGGVALTAFLVWEAHHAHPILDLRLFRRPGFCAAGAAIFLTGAAVYGSTWLAPLYVQLVQHYTPLGAGEILLPAGVAMAVSFPLAGRLSDRMDARILMAAGAMMFGASMLLLSDVSTGTAYGAVAAALALGRAGVGTIMPPANASAMRHAPGLLAQAAPAATFLSQTGGAMGVALLSALLQQRTAFHADALAPGVDTAQAFFLLAAGMQAAGLSAAEASAAAMGQISSAVWASAQMLAFRDCFLATAFAGLFLLPIMAFMPADRFNFIDRLKSALTLFR
jgi:DHA2 family multidrug resistance protein